MRCAAIFTKITRHGDINLGMPYSEQHVGESHYVRTANDRCFLPAGRYTVSAAIGIRKPVTVQVIAMRDEGGYDTLPAAGKASLPYTFDIAEARSLRFEFGIGEEWADEDIETAGAVTNVIVHDENGSTNDEYETRALHPGEISDSSVIAQAINSKSSITLEIYPDFDVWGFCERSITYVTVLDLDKSSDRTIFRGRVLAVSDVMDSGGKVYQTITCVSSADFLEDFPSPSFGSRRRLRTVLTETLERFSQNVDDFRKIYTDSNSFPTYQNNRDIYTYDVESQYATTFSAINRLLTSGDNLKIGTQDEQSIAWFPGTLAVEWRERYQNGKTFFDISERFGTNCDTAFVIGENLSDIRIEKNTDGGIYTAIRAYTGVNSDGYRESFTAYNYAMAARYGTGRTLVLQNDAIRCTAPKYEKTEWGTTTYTDAWVAMVEAVTAYAKQEARKLSEPPIKITLTAVDLATMGFSGYEPFEVGNRHPLVYPPGGYFGQKVRITGIRRQLSGGKIEQITIEAGKKVVRSSSSLSAMMSRLEELNQQISDNAAEQVEIAQTVAEEIVEEQTDGVKIKLSHPQGYGEVQHLNLVTDENGRTDLYADEYLIGGSGGYSILGLTKAQYDALETYSNKTIYVVDNSGTTEMYVGDQLITQKGGGGATIETATVLSSEQMTEWAPEHALVPVEFRGNAHVYYAQPPAKIVIQGQRGLFGSQTITTSDLAAEIAFDFTQNEQTVRQKLKAFVASFSYSNNDLVVQLGVACYDITGAAEVLVGFGTVSQSAALALPLSSVSIGLLLVVESLTAQDSEELVPQCRVRVGYISGQNQGFWNAPSITGSLFNGTFAVDFGSDAERGFASGIARRTEPSYDNDESEEAAENDNS